LVHDEVICDPEQGAWKQEEEDAEEAMTPSHSDIHTELIL